MYRNNIELEFEISEIYLIQYVIIKSLKFYEYYFVGTYF